MTADTIIDLFPKTLWGKQNPDQVCRPNLNHCCQVTDRENWMQLCERLNSSGMAIGDGSF
ncbi:MAG: hypothetical protein C0619_11810 [Desulfuromonas sp.]|nr:MAG: hypothetical protein C0619_11810 [Desulfuromonas sp.]